MKRLLTVAIVVIVVLISFFIAWKYNSIQFTPSTNISQYDNTLTKSNYATTMKIVSSAFLHDGSIPRTYTCDGPDINPPFKISDVPKDARSLVLLMDDPDVPKNIRADGMWDHWIKFNIPPDTTVIEEGKEPEGVSGKGTSGNFDYHGPCPPDRKHRYFFKLYALDALLDLPEGASKSDVESAMEGHVLEKAELIGRYERN